MQELKALPPDAWEREQIPPLLVRLHIENPNAATAPDLTKQEKEIGTGGAARA